MIMDESYSNAYLLRVLTEEDGWFFDRARAQHESFALSWTYQSDCLLGLSLQPHDGLRNNFELFWKMVSFL